MARSTAPLFATGSTPGSAMSTAQACTLGAAPNRVDAPENIFDVVESWAWISNPITVSHCMRSSLTAIIHECPKEQSRGL